MSSLIGSTGRNHDNGRMIEIERVGSFIKWHGNQITSAVNITMKWAWSLHVIIKWNRCHLQMSCISRIASLVFINIVFRRSEHFNFQLLKWQDRSKQLNYNSSMSKVVTTKISNFYFSIINLSYFPEFNTWTCYNSLLLIKNLLYSVISFIYN